MICCDPDTRDCPLVKHEHPGVERPPLREGRAQGPMEALFEIEDAAPLDDVGEQVAIERRVVGEQLRQVCLLYTSRCV